MNEEDYAKRVVAEKKIPDHLFKYRSLAGDTREYTRRLIVNQELYFPAPADLNDPFECKPHLDSGVTAEEKKRYVKGLVNRWSEGAPRAERRRLQKTMNSDREFGSNMERSTRDSLENIGIYSLSGRPLDLLMWPHYADQHRGICVGLSYLELGVAGHAPLPVEYAACRPVCNTLREDTVQWLEKAVLTKGAPWAYEEEWRVLRIRGARSTVHLNRPAVQGVLLGANISNEDRGVVLQWVKDSGRSIAVAQAKFHSTEYALEVEDIC
jgi:hypothetical protein